MKMNIKALGLSIGIVLGTVVFLMTVIVLIGDYGFFSGFDGSFLGYSLSWIGAFIGLIYGFIVGYILGTYVGFLYNKFAK